MRFSIYPEVQSWPGKPYDRLYGEVLEQIENADRLGYDAYAAVEHFFFPKFSASENGVTILGWHLNLPTGTADIVIGTLMAVVLILHPAGLTGGRELTLPRRRRVADLRKARAPT